MKKGASILLIGLALLFLVILVFSLPQIKAIANPAAFYCKELGYEYQINSDAQGNEYGVCTFQDSECEEWSFYEGECGEEFAQEIDISEKLKGTALKLPKKSEGKQPKPLGLGEPKLGSEYNASNYSVWDWRDPPAGTRFASYDWMTSVKNQGSCGSCWAFAALGVVEARYNTYNNDSAIDLNLSEQELVSCCGSCGDCDGGLPEEALDYTKDNGSIDEPCFLYNGSCSTGVCDPCSNRCSDYQDRDYKITNRILISDDINSTKQALIDYGPLSVVINVTDTSSPNFQVGECTKFNQGNHAVVLVGYNNSESKWIIKNSWGSSWNESGYAKVSYDKLCTQTAYTYAKLAVSATETKPSSTAASPSDNYNTSTALVTFNCSAQDLDGMNRLHNITLYGSWGGWHANQTENVTGTSNSTTFSLNLSNGTYTWGCFVSCQAELTKFSSNKTLTIDQIEPTVNSESPANDSVENSSDTVTFSYNVSDSLAIANCSLYLNGSLNETDSSIEKDTTQNFTKTLSIGTYNWSIVCIDSVGNSGQSEERLLQITVAPPSVTLEEPVNTLNSSTLQTTFNCSATDNAALKNITLYIWNSTGLFYNNSENITGTSNSSEWQVNLTANQDYNWSCLVYDNDSLSDWADNRSVTIDTLDPSSIDLNLSSTSIDEGDDIDITCTAEDNGTGIKNITIGYDEIIIEECSSSPCEENNYEPNWTGQETITCTVYDYASNSDTDTEELDVEEDNGGGGGSSGSSDDSEDDEEETTEEEEIEEPTYDINAELEQDKKESKKLAEGESVGFKIKGESHKVEVDEVNADEGSVKLKISSITLYITISINETRQLDLDANGIKDLAITLLGIEDGEVDLQFEILEDEDEVEAKATIGNTPLGVINATNITCGNNICEEGENCLCGDCPCAEEEMCFLGKCVAKSNTIKWSIISAVIIIIVAVITILLRKKFAIIKFGKRHIIRKRH